MTPNTFQSVFTVEKEGNLPDVPEYEYDTELTNMDIPVESVRKQLANLKKTKAPGPDGLSPRILSELSDVLALPVTIVFKKSMEAGKISEDVQRRATKLIASQKDKPYPERLAALNLPSLEHRRLRGDMIDMYKYTHGLYLTSRPHISYYQGRGTRGRSLKLDRSHCRLNIRSSFFVQRVTATWNSLPEQAASCDRRGDRTQLLHGVPLSLKENLSLQGYDTTVGLQKNIGVPCETDAVVVQVFERHGAVPFVRTNIPQTLFSCACSNPIFGVTLNPHNTDHCPGGSSGGEGAILGGGASIIGLGTDVGGSVRIPAAFCGVCALKPTLGRFSEDPPPRSSNDGPSMNMSTSFDRNCPHPHPTPNAWEWMRIGTESGGDDQSDVSGVVGPMTRDVDSLVVMTRVMASPDMWELDPALPPLPFQEQLLTSSHKLRIGYYTWDGNLHPVPMVCRAVREAKAALEALGHTLICFDPPEASEATWKMLIGSVLGADQGRSLRDAIKDDYVEAALKSTLLPRLPRWAISLLCVIASRKEPVRARIMKNLKKDG
ncbi:vitamin D3 hydroxylase-associated protein-like [Babylonia areolata]|uniref:vitamin D3 hydroxylase-associated protein-like n=1 Tax=Babylonia areolata TaxID=304850 RepID=UPI003FCFC412